MTTGAQTATGVAALEVVAEPASATVVSAAPATAEAGQTTTVQLSGHKTTFASGTSTADLAPASPSTP